MRTVLCMELLTKNQFFLTPPAPQATTFYFADAAATVIITLIFIFVPSLRANGEKIKKKRKPAYST